MTPKSRAKATGYTSTAAQGGNPRITEGWALIEAARRMAESITMKGDENERKEAMKKAARLNWRLWTIFQSEMTVDENDVPFEIRINMLTLCKFIDKHMVGVLAGPTPELLATMIDINRNIAAGLMELPDDDVLETEETNAANNRPDEPEDAPVTIDQEA